MVTIGRMATKKLIDNKISVFQVMFWSFIIIVPGGLHNDENNESD